MNSVIDEISLIKFIYENFPSHKMPASKGNALFSCGFIADKSLYVYAQRRSASVV